MGRKLSIYPKAARLALLTTWVCSRTACLGHALEELSPPWCSSHASDEFSPAKYCGDTSVPGTSTVGLEVLRKCSQSPTARHLFSPPLGCSWHWIKSSSSLRMLDSSAPRCPGLLLLARLWGVWAFGRLGVPTFVMHNVETAVVVCTYSAP